MYTKPGKRRWGGSVSTGCFPKQISNSVLPFITVSVCGVHIKALLDTGCEQSVILQRFADQLKLQSRGPERQVLMLNGHVTKCKGESLVTVTVSDTRKLDLCCLVAPSLVGGCFMILGMDGILREK